MKSNNLPKDRDLRGALPALKRASQRALELARRTGTPCWVLRDGRMVDIAKEFEARSRNLQRQGRLQRSGK